MIDKCSDCGRIGKIHIHHKDGNHYNNSIENLEQLKKSEHLVEHSDAAYANFSQGCPVFEKIVSIVSAGIEDTYDIECEEPHHNFVANGIIVHNSGKSVLGLQIAKYIDPTFCLARTCFTAEEFAKVVKNAEKFQAIVFDEAVVGLASRGAMSKTNRVLVSMIAQIRQKNLFVIIIIPSFFDLDKNIALHRSRALIHVSFKENFTRGSFWLYDSFKKTNLHVFGKKTYSYGCTRPSFVGGFNGAYVLDEVEYRKKKLHSLELSCKRAAKEAKEADEMKNSVRAAVAEMVTQLLTKKPEEKKEAPAEPEDAELPEQPQDLKQQDSLED